MSKSQFHALAQSTLRVIDETLAEVDPDQLDVDWAGDVMQLCFSDGTVFVLNAHSAAEQIWLAAGTQAWHFDPPSEKEGPWRAPKNGDELYPTLSKVVGEKLGTAVTWPQ